MTGQPTKVQALAHAVAAYSVLRTALTEAQRAEAEASDKDNLPTGRAIRMKDLRRVTNQQYKLAAALEECVKNQMSFSFDDWDDRQLLMRCLRELQDEGNESYVSAVELLAVGRDEAAWKDLIVSLKAAPLRTEAAAVGAGATNPSGVPRNLLEFVATMAFGGFWR